MEAVSENTTFSIDVQGNISATASVLDTSDSFEDYNVSYVLTSTNLTVELEGDGSSVDYCSDWLSAQHAVFQLANLCMLVSFLTPSNFKHHCLFLRLMLNFGYVLGVIWGALFVCMLDILSWNAAFLLVNSAHLAYLCYSVVPHRFSKTLEEVYTHTFKPLKISRCQFRAIAELGSIMLLAKGAVYARQGHNKTGQKLTLLLRGRLTVTYDDTYLHSVEANHFIDSPEYDIVQASGREDTFQVTINASEDCLLFTWSYSPLVHYLNANPGFKHKFDKIIGKDISQKLYEIQERLMAHPHLMEAIGTRRSSMVHVRNSIVSSSQTNLTKLNCLQGCMVHNEQPSNLSSNGTYETCL